MARLRIGSRGSQLALWQANHVAGLLRQRGHDVEIEVIRTTGDKITDVALARVGTKGMFIKEIEEALAEGRVQLAVHSLKDLPTDLLPDFTLAAVMEREDPRDVFVSKRFARLLDLPQGARVGTSSLRREAQVRALRADLVVHPLRGNVDTRLRKLEAGEFDAILLAAAGVKRLGRTQVVREVLPIATMCPAAGQGALAVEARAADRETLALLEFLDHPASRHAVLCERALLRTLGGGCQVPIGACAEPDGDGLRLTAVVARPDGSAVLRETANGPDAEELGRSVGQRLLQKGAAEILRDVYGASAAVPQQP
ncbi:MAG TPA: hydroxymethylbilane synthase [Terriglobales bacterium]|nr:hydroxymethylbilane synthase [Terriglobales bacterium]